MNERTPFYGTGTAVGASSNKSAAEGEVAPEVLLRAAKALLLSLLTQRPPGSKRCNAFDSYTAMSAAVPKGDWFSATGSDAAAAAAAGDPGANTHPYNPFDSYTAAAAPGDAGVAMADPGADTHPYRALLFGAAVGLGGLRFTVARVCRSRARDQPRRRQAGVTSQRLHRGRGPMRSGWWCVCEERAVKVGVV